MNKPDISPKEYAFYEWLILEKNVTNAIFSLYTLQDKIALFSEFSKEYDKAIKIEVKAGPESARM